MQRGRFFYALILAGIAVLFFLGGWLVRYTAYTSLRVSPGVYSNISPESAGAQRLVLRIEGRAEMKGMVCDGCARRVHAALMKVPGVEAVRVDLSTQEAQVIADIERVTAAQLLQAINDADFDAVVQGPSS